METQTKKQHTITTLVSVLVIHTSGLLFNR